MARRMVASAYEVKSGRRTYAAVKALSKYTGSSAFLSSLSILAGFLLARVLPGNPAAPFGLAFYTAIRSAGVSATGALPVALAVILGSASVLSPILAGWIGAVLFALHFVANWFRIGTIRGSSFGAAIMSMTGAFTLITISNGTQSMQEALLWCGIAGILTLIFAYGITDILPSRNIKVNATNASVSIVVILSMMLCGINGQLIHKIVSLQDVIAGCIILLYVYTGGVVLGTTAAAALAAGFIFTALKDNALAYHGLSSADVTVLQAHALAYVTAGLLAGIFRRLGRLGITISFYFTMVAYSMVVIRDWAYVKSVFYSAGISSALFLMAPASILSALSAACSYKQQRDQRERIGKQYAYRAIIERLLNMSHALREVCGALDQATTIEVQQDSEQEQAVQQVAGRVCRSCSMHQHCWEREFDQTRNSLADLWNWVDAGQSSLTQPLPEGIVSHCIYPTPLVAAMNYFHDMNRFRHQWERRLEEGRAAVGDYMKSVARMLRSLAEDNLSPGAKSSINPLGGMRVFSAIARLPKRGGHISGDSAVSCELGNDRYLMVLSDGMGVGRGAALESGQCVDMIRNMLYAGFPTQSAVSIINSVFLFRSPDDTFVTVDLCLFDLATGQAEFVKVGAPPSFIKRGEDVTLIKASSVPVGIINQVQVESEFRTLRSGDVLVMITDGVWDVLKSEVDKERWILEHLHHASHANPQQLAESILARALEATSSADDDMTVLVARIDTTEEEAELGYGVRTADTAWAPARKAPSIKRENVHRSRGGSDASE